MNEPVLARPTIIGENGDFELAPGQSLTTVPDYWCETCKQARPKQRCALCGTRTVLRAELDHDPAAAAATKLAELQNVPVATRIDGALVDGSAATIAAPPPPPPDPHEQLEGAFERVLDAEDLIRETTTELGFEPGPRLLNAEEAIGLVQAMADAGKPSSAARMSSGTRLVDRLRERELERQRELERAAQPPPRPSLPPASGLHRTLMERRGSPFTRGREDKVFHRSSPLLRENATMQNTRATVSHEIDERGREVQRTGSRRGANRSVEDQLVSLWEKATIDETKWCTFLAAAMQRAESMEDAAALADAAYLQLLIRQRYATTG